MPSFKPAYLIHGDDHGRIAERRARLRALAEQDSGAAGIELFEGDASDPDKIVAALNAMTFALGRRFIVADGVERWKDNQLDALEVALRALAPDTTVAFFAREDARCKAPPRLAKAVLAAGGDVSPQDAVKPWELPKWAVAQARELGLELSSDAARALIALVGERQQRLLRELEKLALYAGAGARVDVEEVEMLSARSSERKAWSLGDAILSGEREHALRLYLELREQGERLPGLIYALSSRLRQAAAVAAALDAGRSRAEVRATLRMPSRAADKLIADAGRLGAEPLREWVARIADLELASRGGFGAGLGEDSQAVLALLGASQ